MAADPLAGLDTTSPFGNRKASPREKLTWQIADWDRLPREWRRRLRKRFARPVTGPFDLVQDGISYRLYPSENHCDRVLFARNRLPERAEHEALLPHLKPGMVFVDIGANIGSYSLFVGHRAPGATLIACEPHPRTAAKLRFNLAANELPTEHVFQCAVGPQETSMTLWSDGGGNIGHTSLLKEGTANAKIGINVPVRPLLDILSEAGVDRIDTLKIDIEGYEDRALAPFLSEATAELRPGTILLETAHKHLWETDLLRLLEELAYEPVFRTAENVLLKRPV